MILPFSFARTPFIHFGPGKISLLPSIIPAGSKVLIVTGRASFVSSARWQLLQEQFAEKQIRWEHFVVDKEPSPAMIDDCVNRYRENNIQTVVAIGGGSVVDAGKAISGMLPVDDSVRLYLEGVGTKVHPGVKVPFIALPTTAGTGSEATKNAVLSEVGEMGFKKSLRHNHFVPDVAIIDPELALGCPRKVTASTGMDAFTQLLESYISTAASPMTDPLALEGLRHVQGSLMQAWEQGDTDLKARTGMAYASLISGITLANAGLGTVHGFASSIGGYFDIPHGVVCSALMAPANKVTARKLFQNDPRQALVKYAEAGKIFAGNDNRSKEYYTEYLIHKIEEWTTAMQIPKLGDYGVSRADFNKIIKATENKNNPVDLDEEELAEVLELAL